MTLDKTAKVINMNKNNSNQNHVNSQRDGKRYPLAFIKPNGKKGDLCFYMNYGIDTYRSGCYNDCLYCFARSIIQNRYKSKWKPNDVSIIDYKACSLSNFTMHLRLIKRPQRLQQS